MDSSDKAPFVCFTQCLSKTDTVFLRECRKARRRSQKDRIGRFPDQILLLILLKQNPFLFYFSLLLSILHLISSLKFQCWLSLTFFNNYPNFLFFFFKQICHFFLYNFFQVHYLLSIFKAKDLLHDKATFLTDYSHHFPACLASCQSLPRPGAKIIHLSISVPEVAFALRKLSRAHLSSHPFLPPFLHSFFYSFGGRVTSAAAEPSCALFTEPTLKTFHR